MFQQKLAKKLAKYQRKISDIHVQHLGTEQTLVRMSITTDKYEDSDYTITANEKISGILVYPDNEVPISQGTNNNNTTQNNLHLYDFLPIELFVKNTTDLKYGDIIFQKLKVNTNLLDTDSNAYRLISLQVVDINYKFTVEKVWSKYILAPYTLSIEFDNLPELQTIIDNYLSEEW